MVRKLKVKRHSRLAKNVFLFLITSFFFLQIIKSLALGISALNLDNFKQVIYSNNLLVILGIVTAHGIWSGQKYSKYLLAVFMFSINYLAITTYGQNVDNKLILVLNFIYLLTSYYYFLLWKLELDDAIYNPSFFNNSLRDFIEYDFCINLIDGENKIPCQLSNWGAKSFFMFVNDAKKFKGIVSFEIIFCEQVFSFKARVSTMSAGGIGLRVEGGDNIDSLGWSDFYDIISARAYKTNYLGSA